MKLGLIVFVFTAFASATFASEKEKVVGHIKESYQAWEDDDWKKSWETYSPEFRRRCDKKDMITFLRSTKEKKKIAKIKLDNFSVVFTSGKNAAMVTYDMAFFDTEGKQTLKKSWPMLVEKVNGKWYSTEECYPKS